MTAYKILKELAAESHIEVVEQSGWTNHPVYAKIGSGMSDDVVAQLAAGWRVVQGQLSVDPDVYEQAVNILGTDNGLWSQQAYADAVVGVALHSEDGDIEAALPLESQMVLFMVHCEATRANNAGLDWIDDVGLTVEDMLENSWELGV